MALEAYNKCKDSPYAPQKLEAVDLDWKSNLRDIDDCDSDTKEAILLYHICIIMPESTLAMIERTDAHFVGVGLFGSIPNFV